jgi:hypothetical protein
MAGHDVISQEGHDLIKDVAQAAFVCTHHCRPGLAFSGFLPVSRKWKTDTIVDGNTCNRIRKGTIAWSAL